MYAVHIYTEIERDEPNRGETVEEALTGYDLTDRKVENIFELAGGDIAIVEKEPEEEPEGYRFQSINKSANYLNVALRVMDAFGEGMKDSSRVFDAARIALVLKKAGLYVFPLCNPFIDLLVSAIHDSGAGLAVEEVLEWIVKVADSKEHYSSDGVSELYTSYIERFGNSGQTGLRELAIDIVSCVHESPQPDQGEKPCLS